MDFPPAWEFLDLEDFDGFGFRQHEVRPLGLEVILKMEGGVASDFRMASGGNAMLSVRFKADKLLGSKFPGTFHS